MDFDASTLSLTVGASVEYVGRSADGNFDDDFNLGMNLYSTAESVYGLTVPQRNHLLDRFPIF